MILRATRNGAKNSTNNIQSAIAYVSDMEKHHKVEKIYGDDPNDVINHVMSDDKHKVVYDSLVLGFSPEESKKLTKKDCINILRNMEHNIFTHGGRINRNAMSITGYLHEKKDGKKDIHIIYARSLKNGKEFNPLDVGRGDYKFATPQQIRKQAWEQNIINKYNLDIPILENYKVKIKDPNTENKGKNISNKERESSIISKITDFVYYTYIEEKINNDPSRFNSREELKKYLNSTLQKLNKEGNYKSGMRILIKNDEFDKIINEKLKNNPKFLKLLGQLDYKLDRNKYIKLSQYNKSRFIIGGPANEECLNSPEKIAEREIQKGRERLTKTGKNDQLIYGEYLKALVNYRKNPTELNKEELEKKKLLLEQANNQKVDNINEKLVKNYSNDVKTKQYLDWKKNHTSKNLYNPERSKQNIIKNAQKLNHDLSRYSVFSRRFANMGIGMIGTMNPSPPATSSGGDCVSMFIWKYNPDTGEWECVTNPAYEEWKKKMLEQVSHAVDSIIKLDKNMDMNR
jgi:hypothetical protein